MLLLAAKREQSLHREATEEERHRRFIEKQAAAAAAAAAESGASAPDQPVRISGRVRSLDSSSVLTSSCFVQCFACSSASQKALEAPVSISMKISMSSAKRSSSFVSVRGIVRASVAVVGYCRGGGWGAGASPIVLISSLLILLTAGECQECCEFLAADAGTATTAS